MVQLEGTITALITPFTEEGSVDMEGYRKQIRYQIENRIDGILPLGTTGETPTLTDPEREAIIRLAVAEAKGKVPVIIGTGSYCTANSVSMSRKAQDLGADAVLIVTPYYNKPTDEGIYRHFKAINDALSIPIIVYNIAGRTGKNICTNLMKRLSTLSHVTYVKEASGNICQMAEVILETDLIVLSGDDFMTLPLMSLGGKGVISVLSNLVPDRITALCNAAASGDFDSARNIHFALSPLMKAAFLETNPTPIKYMMNRMGMPAGGCRLPLCEISPSSKSMIESLMKEGGLL